MNIPDKIVISGVEYRVIHEEKPLFNGNLRAYGHIDFDNKEISIDKGLGSPQGHKQTLIHEIIHGIVYDREIDFGNNGEETIVNQLASGLYQVIKDNQSLFKVIE